MWEQTASGIHRAACCLFLDHAITFEALIIALLGSVIKKNLVPIWEH